jgi:hypothetical protein
MFPKIELVLMVSILLAVSDELTLMVLPVIVEKKVL